MSQPSASGEPVVAVVGGGLAGLAAAVALVSAGCRVELFEARRALGGRAGSFRDPTTGELVDHCQHVSMGCCTNLADFCRRTGIADLFRRDRVLHFIGPEGQECRLAASRWLPAPLHLGPAFWGLEYLSWQDRLRIARACWKLMRMRPLEAGDERTIGEWLKTEGQSAVAIERFWEVVLVSTLAEELDRASLGTARKVFIDGFLAAREAYVVDVPTVPLGILYDQRVAQWLGARGATLCLQSAVRRVSCEPAPRVVTADGTETRADAIVLALPWNKVGGVVDEKIAAQWPWLPAASALESAPITGIHLWFDRPIMDQPHAVLVGRLSQWVFNRGTQQADDAQPAGHYYQVVISASYALQERDRAVVIEQVCRELAEVWPATLPPKLLASRVISEPQAVFSARPAIQRARPAQATAVGAIAVAGDWTDTGWPSTMESAVRSGYRAAEAVLATLGRPQRFLVDDLPRGWLARLLIR